MSDAIVAALMLALMLGLVAVLQAREPAIPDLTAGRSLQHSNPWIRPVRVRA